MCSCEPVSCRSGPGRVALTDWCRRVGQKLSPAVPGQLLLAGLARKP